MNIIEIAQIVGIVSIFLVYFLTFLIGIRPSTRKRTLRITVVWLSIFVFFLFVLRVISYFEWATQEQLRIISGFASAVPLIAVITQLFLEKKLSEDVTK